MVLTDPEKLKPNDIVLVKRLLKNNMNFLVGRVANTNYEYKGERHVVVWGNWREERAHASVYEHPVFSCHFNTKEPGLQIFRTGRWVNGGVKTREGEACFILDNLLMELKSTGLVRVDSIIEAEKFLRG